MLAWLGSGDGSVAGLQKAAFSPSSLMTFPQRVGLETEVMGLGPHDPS